MVDAKLIAVTLTIGMVVVVALTYVSTRSSRANAVEYTDDWSKRMAFICTQQVDSGGCMISLCDQFMDGTIDETTKFRIDCKDETSRSASLHDLGNNEDWYERAMGAGGNTQAPFEATMEWCYNTEGEDDDSGYDFVSGDEENHSCAAVVPMLAAAINAEYTRYVTRAHIGYFRAGFDAFCSLDKIEGIAKGCADAEFGFGYESTFQAVCDDGQLATFDFLKTVAELDKLAEKKADNATIAAFIEGHCPEAETLHYVPPTCVKPCIEACLADLDADACICADSCNRDSCDEADKAYIQEGVDAECKGRRLSSGVNQLPDKSGATSALANLLIQRSKSGGGKSPIRVSRSLHSKHHHHNPHHHNPHHHNPHGHATGGACPGCGNICGNPCFGRCGAGCQKWNACGGGGAGAHRACVEHDFECSCGSMLQMSCMGLMWSGDNSQKSKEACKEGNNIFGSDKSICNQDGNIFGEMGLGWFAAVAKAVKFEMANTWYINSAVRNWGVEFGNLGDDATNGKACQRVQMCDNHGGNKYGKKSVAKRVAANRWHPLTANPDYTDNPYGVTVDMVLDDCTIAEGSGVWDTNSGQDKTKRGDGKNLGTCESWEEYDSIKEVCVAAKKASAVASAVSAGASSALCWLGWDGAC